MKLSRSGIINLVAALCAALCAPAAFAASTFPQNPVQKKIHVDGASAWIDTGVDLQPQDQLTIQASGSLVYGGKESTADGLARGWRDLVRALPLESAGTTALIGRIGSDNAPPFLIGRSHRRTVTQAGRLYLSVNRLSADLITGDGFDVTIEVGRSQAAAIQPSRTAAELPTAALNFPEFPARISDGKGHDGDTVNLLIIGSREQLLATFTAAGWEQADKTIRDTLLHGTLSSLSKNAYLTLPMSQLVLFGRTQDFGMEHAEAVSVAASRHHLRLWQAPFQVNGEQVWIGAATHDIGFDRDQRNNGITHKIDPNVDIERAYVQETLWSTGLVDAVGLYTPPHPVTVARTATGEEFHSDGRVFVAKLKGQSTRAGDLARNFCSVLQSENPDGGTWSACGDYLSEPSSTGAASAAAPLHTDLPVLILPGFFSDCLTTSQPFHEALEHLKSAHQIKGEYLQLKNVSSTANAQIIADYLRAHFDGTHKYILVGYSKGATDGYEALATFPDLQTRVAAFVSVAGAVGGSRLVDVMPGGYAHWLQSIHFGACEGDLTAAIDSLSYRNRQKFLSSNGTIGVPSYTLVAQSDLRHVSKLLAQTWEVLSVNGIPQDAQLLASDATVPGSQYLGAANADHLAVAINFATSSVPEAMRDHNQYPRAALLEAIVRVVVDDLSRSAAAAH
jgi:pimeloyl-ACP methyl ester carboxylesterase